MARPPSSVARKISRITSMPAAAAVVAAIDDAVIIDGAVDEKVLLGAGDSVYLRYPKDKAPQVGKRYSIYEPTKEVKGKGSFVHVVGTVEVVSVKEDKRARGVIIDS